MKILLGIAVGVIASKPLLKAADKYLGKGVKVKIAEKVAESLLNLHLRANDYAKDNV